MASVYDIIFLNMRRGVTLAITLSLILVIGAFWMKNSGPNSGANLISGKAKTGQLSGTNEAFLNSILKASSAEKQEPITDTDLMGRQLLMEYVSLAKGGEVDEKELTALAEKYVQGIPAIAPSVEITSKELRVVPDNQANFERYLAVATKIVEEYRRRVATAEQKPVNFNVFGTDVMTLTQNLSKAYLYAAENLKAMEVPSSLASSHLKLVNMYLTNAASMESITNVDANAAQAFAGMLSVNTNIEMEKATLEEINAILSTYGL